MPNFRNTRSQAVRKSDETDYIIAYSEVGASNPVGLKGNKISDSNKGVYHLYLGANKGLVKEINFAAYDIPYRKESLMVESVNLYNQLRMPYTANIQMFGNNMFLPGSMIFINPSSGGFGNPLDYNNASTKLGIGGYYQIIRVSTSYSAGGDFTTSLETSYNLSFANEPNPSVPQPDGVEMPSPSTNPDAAPPAESQEPDTPPSFGNTAMEEYPSDFRIVRESPHLTLEQKQVIMSDYYSRGAMPLGNYIERSTRGVHVTVYRVSSDAAPPYTDSQGEYQRSEVIIKFDRRSGHVTITRPSG